MSNHVCNHAIVHCIDFRFQTALDQFMQEQNLCGDCDRIGIAGGVKNLGEMFHEIDLSETLHQVKHVYLINHQDCGAYGPEIAKNLVKELEKHTQDLNQAKQIINQKFPKVHVHTYFLKQNKQFIKI